MSDRNDWGANLVQSLTNECGDHLRSVVEYTNDSYTVHFLRDDVRDAWDTNDFELALRELRLETIETDHINSLFEEMHGGLNCRIDVFSEAIEMNFVIDSCQGLEVAIDREHFDTQDELIEDIIDRINDQF